MSLVALRKRHNLCKICCSFEDTLLNEITLDMLLNRRSYKEIKEHYTPLLPLRVLPLNDMNISNHKRHSDAALLARESLQKEGIATTEVGIISDLYKERFKGEVNRITILRQTYRERLNNLLSLQRLLNIKKQQYNDLVAGKNPSFTQELRNLTEAVKSLNRVEFDGSGCLITEIKCDIRELKKQVLLKSRLQREIRQLTQEIDSIHRSVQEVIIKEFNSEKSTENKNFFITQNISLKLQDSLKAFMDEIIPALMLDFFKENSSEGTRAVKLISQSMDRHIGPSVAVEQVVNSVENVHSEVVP